MQRAANLKAIADRADVKFHRVRRQPRLADPFIEKPIHRAVACHVHCAGHVAFDGVLKVGGRNSLETILRQQIVEQSDESRIGILGSRGGRSLRAAKHHPQHVNHPRSLTV